MSGELTPIQRKLITKLYYHGYVGARQAMLESIVKGFPKHARGEVAKEAERLVRKGWLLKHPTGYGMRVSINPARATEAKRIAEQAEP